jgi:hypothetical protein
MINTKIKKAMAIMSIAAIAVSSLGNTFAAQIGTGSVNGTSTFDAGIIWDDAFPGSATGSVTGIIVTATVDPVLNMEISTGAIALGSLNSVTSVTGSLDLEIGTNAIGGVVITARSQSGALTNTSSGAIKIISTNAGESYKFTSALNAAEGADSSYGDFASSAALSQEVLDNTTEHTIFTSNRPETTSGTDDVTFSVSSKVTDQTAA